MAVIFELNQIERRNSSVRGVPGDQIELMRRERGVGQIKRHVTYPCKSQTVCTRKPVITVGAHHKIMTKTRVPLWRLFTGIGNCFEIQAACIFPTDENRERIIKTQGIAEPKIELAVIFTLDLIIDSFRIADRLMM